MDKRFQPPSERFNIEKNGLMLKTINDYDAESKKNAEVNEALKKGYFNKDEIRKWILVTLAGNFILIAASISSVSMWIGKKEAKDNTQDEKIEDNKKNVADVDSRVTLFITNDNIIKEKNTFLWHTLGIRVTILETEKKYK